jgi:UDP-N-acetylmuramate dehydrogenase
MGDVALPLAELKKILGSAARFNEPLSRHSALRTGGPADLFFSARTTEELTRAVVAVEELGVPWRIIGGASNLLVADEGVVGLVVKAASSHVEQMAGGTPSELLLRAEAGCMLAAVGKQAALRGYGGLEWAVNVPGSVGASVVNNSGAFGSSIAEHIVSAEIYIPGRGAVSFDAGELGYDYRTSRLKRGELVGAVLRATYRVAQGEPTQLRARIGEIQRTRRLTQPSSYSLGSVFANPPGDYSGRLIEASGLKGFSIGDAEVSTLHANFIVNRGSATSRDVLRVMKHVQSTVWQRHGVWLKPELQLMGRFAEDEVGGLSAPPGAVA